MATVSERPRARRARQPRPSAPSPAEARIPEGWQPGGQARPAEPVAPPPAAPPVRHGKCSLTLRIGGTEYRLRPFPPAAGSGIRAIWTLRKIQPDPLKAPVAYAVALGDEGAACTCPDCEINGATCKHVMALAALRLIPAPAGQEGGAR